MDGGEERGWRRWSALEGEGSEEGWVCLGAELVKRDDAYRQPPDCGFQGQLAELLPADTLSAVGNGAQRTGDVIRDSGALADAVSQLGRGGIRSVVR